MDRSELEWESTDAAKTEHVIAQLSASDNRLIVTDEQAVEVTHEVLIRDCPTIRGWIELARREIPILRRLTHATRRWHENGRDPIFLNAADPPRELRQWVRKTTLRLTHLEREYWQASRAERARVLRETRAASERLRREQQQRAHEAIRANEAIKSKNRILVLTAIAGILAISAGFFASWTWKVNSNKAALLHYVSVADTASGRRASEENFEDLQKGERAESVGGTSKWHESVGYFTRALELEPENQRAGYWLYSILLHRGHG